MGQDTATDNRPIGVFDSGVGGLTVVREIFARLPNEEIAYFGDTLRAPYGVRDNETIKAFTFQMCDFLVSKGAKALVVACNTIDALCLDEIAQKFGLPTIGVIEPACREAVRLAQSSVGLMATNASVRSGAHERLFRRLGGSQAFHACACPSLTPLVEDGLLGTGYALDEVRNYAGELLENNIDTLILGCTHYPFLFPEVETVTGGKVNIVNPARGTAEALAQALSLQHIERDALTPPQHKFFISGDRAKFDTIYKIISDDTPDVAIHVLGE